ncbi:MAG TPA: hypothetical protein VFV99_26930 [Kofleriaceae bacterium]|nr:hypothetical protein [Kofleriaceae bacterium]
MLILLAPLAACSHATSDIGGDLDAGADDGSDNGSADVDAPAPVGPDLTCLSQPQPMPPTIAVDPMVLAGRVVEFTTSGVTPVDAADVVLFVAGQPTVLARTHSASNGAFATGAVTTNGHAVHAYLKATKPNYRTAFFYPPLPFTANSTTLVVPTLSDAVFATAKTLLGATQDDRHNGALLVAVLDCDGQPLAGATLSVRRGNSSVGHAYDLGTVVPADAGVFIVFDVPDGKVNVSASYQGAQLPEHDVMVRGSDPDCSPPRGTLTSTIVQPNI